MPAKTRPVRKTSPARHSRNRTKLSTTVAPENFTFLELLVSTGRSDSIAAAVDLAIGRLRRMENRRKLEDATAAYFDSLSPEAQSEEESLARQLHTSAGGIDFDSQP